MVTVKKQLVTNSVNIGKSRNSKRSIAIHETANLTAGANAQAHANLQTRGNARNASWHYQVDDKHAIQSFTHDTVCFHAGTTAGNASAIGIEICVNSDGDFRKAVANAAELTAIVMKAENIPLSEVKQHNAFSGKNCPTFLRNGSKGVTWADFLRMVKSAYDGGVTQVAKDYVEKGDTGAIVARLQAEMNKTGYKLVVDGIAGDATISAVKDFQRKHGLTVDGIAGAATLAKLEEFTKPQPKPVAKPEEQPLTPAQEATRQEAMRLGITDGKNPRSTPNNHYLWSAMIPLAQRVEALEKALEEKNR